MFLNQQSPPDAVTLKILYGLPETETGTETENGTETRTETRTETETETDTRANA